jgi:chromosome segregation ATPase
MGFASFLRNIIGAAPQAEFDAANVAASSAADARAAADEMKTLVVRVRDEHSDSIERTRSELARLSERVESMPEMRAQLESFVHALGRTMTNAADRLESVDDRMHQVEQQSRSQTEILALSRSELDRQGRSVAGVEGQLKSLEDAMMRLSLASERTEALVREMESRKVRIARAERLTTLAAILGAAALVVAILR